MKLVRSKEWWMARARREGDAAVGAGLLAFDPVPNERPAAAQAETAEENRIAFGKFVRLMRRRRGLSMEKLAEQADIDASELLVIESGSTHLPGARTVFKLAQVFDVSQPRLMELAGLATANDVGLREEAVRFAARSEALHKLTPEESAVLDSFVAVLSGKGPKRTT